MKIAMINSNGFARDNARQLAAAGHERVVMKPTPRLDASAVRVSGIRDDLKAKRVRILNAIGA